MRQGLVVLLATAIGVIVANLYYAQPLVATISSSLGLAPEVAGLVVTLTQVGYGMGVLFLVPLGDIVETRRLLLSTLVIAIAGLLGLAFVSQALPYFIAAFATGLGTSAVQMIMPYGAHFASDERRGQVVGSMTSGLMIGIMLSRPVASLISDGFGWHAVFIAAAVMISLIALVLYKVLPPRPPVVRDLKYFSLLKSMAHLFSTVTILRRRAIYQAFLFGSFCLFWTASPLLLLGPDFQFSQTAIALFALVGVSGAISAPFAGKAADRGHSRIATAVAMIVSMAAFWLSDSITALVAAAILLDAGITANLVLGQRAIFALDSGLRSRLNGIYIATIFIGGASGSALGAWSFARGGWWLTSWIGFAMVALAFLFFLTEKRDP
jgi:predicted MFS family arabinose efflux permease